MKTHMKTLIRSEWRLLLFGFLMTFFSMPGQTLFISLFSAEIRGELGLSHGEFGGIYSLATLCSAIVLIWTGVLSDTWNLRRLSLTIICVLAITSLLMSQVTGIVTLFVVLFLLRQTGQGLMTVCGITALVRYLPQFRGRSAAIGSMGYGCAEALIPITIASVMLIVGWRTTWVITGVFVALTLIPLVFILLKGQAVRHQRYLQSIDDDAYQHNDATHHKHWKRSEVLRHVGFYLVIPAIMVHPLLFTGLTFHQIHLLSVKGWLLTEWTLLFLLYALVSTSSMMIAGILVDIFGAFRILMISPLFIALGFMLLSVATEIEMAAIALLCIAVNSGMYAASTAPFWIEAYGSRYVGAIKSLGYSFVVLFSAASPAIVGWLLDRGVEIESLLFYGALYALGALVLFIIGRPFFVVSRRGSQST